jgi:hypothetical protein
MATVNTGKRSVPSTDPGEMLCEDFLMDYGLELT